MVNNFYFNHQVFLSGLYTVSPASGVVSTQLPLTDIADHVFHIRATDTGGNFATLRVHVTIIGNNKGPEWIFPAVNGDKIVVCEVRQLQNQ